MWELWIFLRNGIFWRLDLSGIIGWHKHLFLGVSLLWVCLLPHVWRHRETIWRRITVVDYPAGTRFGEKKVTGGGDAMPGACTWLIMTSLFVFKATDLLIKEPNITLLLSPTSTVVSRLWVVSLILFSSTERPVLRRSLGHRCNLNKPCKAIDDHKVAICVA